MNEVQRFNAEQTEAIRHGSGPMLVLAGPGSGKTTVIAHRIKYMIEERGIAGSHILVITFTKAAAKEMQERFEQLMQGESGVMFGTFHSVFFMMLRHAYGYRGNDVVTEVEKYQIIKNIIERHRMSYDGQEDFAKTILSEIGYVKSERISAETHESSNMQTGDFQIAYEEYEKALRAERKIDFEDMLVFTYELLAERQDIRRRWQEQFPYILVDEFQDINRVQYETVKLLAGNAQNVFAVGDDDQSVYGFRGANPKIMLGFSNDFPGTKMVYLRTNYRCSNAIVESSKRIIRNNKHRYNKEICSAFSGEPAERVHVIDTDGIREENEEIAKKIRKLNEQGIPYAQIAVLYRTNAEPAGLAMKLMQYNIPFKMRDAIPDLFSHFVVVNILDYIYLALGDRSRDRMLRVMNRPNRYISRDSLRMNETGTEANRSLIDFEMLKEYYKDQPRMIQMIVTFETDLQRISRLKPFAAVNYIRKAIDYDGYLKNYAGYRGLEPDEYLEIADEFQEMARGADSFEQWFIQLEKYREKLQERERGTYEQPDRVTLATMHGAKGLEFDQVMILNAVEGMTPHKKSISDEAIEEERRMFYVAVTRARYGLYIYTPKILYGKPAKISRFVNEMVVDRDLLKTGNKIVHKRYGKGVITYADDKKMCVYFEKGGLTKTLSIEYTTQNHLITEAND